MCCFRSAILSVFVLAWALLAQVDTGNITGTLRDPSGGVLAGASVNIRNEDTGMETKTSTNALGQFVSPPLHPGPYSLTAEMRGFRKTVTTITLTLSQRAVIDLVLPVGSVEEQVTVEAVAPLLESETATVGNLRDERSIRDLPLNTRNFNQLIGLTTGVVPAQTQAGSPALTAIRGTTANSVNGLGFRANHFLVDGLDNSENHNGQGILIYPPLDAIQEFRVQTSVASAEFGRGGGGTINAMYKSGGRNFHGNLFEFFRNSALDAKNFFDGPGKIAPLRLNQFGGTVGGPVLLPGGYNRRRNRTFFFASFEGARVRQALTYLVSVPIPEFRQGNFAQYPNRIYDPLTSRPSGTAGALVRDQFPGSAIPADRLDRVAQNIVKLYPQPNRAGIAANYGSNPPQPTTSNNFDVKIDQNFRSRDQAFFRFSRHGTDQNVPGSLPLPAVGDTASTFKFTAGNTSKQTGVYENSEFKVELNYSGLAVQSDAVGSYIPAQSYLKNSPTALVTLYLKPSTYKGTNLQAAWLNLTASSALDQVSCYEYVNTDGTNIYATYKLDKIREVKGNEWHYTDSHPISGAALGHSSFGELYRLYKNHTCYEVNLAAADFNRYDLDNPKSVKDCKFKQVFNNLGAVFNRLEVY